MARILAVCLSATIERTVTFRNLEFAEVNRSEKYRIDASGKAVNAARVLNQIEPGCVTSVVPLGERNADVFLDLADRDGLQVVAVKIPGFTRECCTLLDSTRGTTTELVINEPIGDCEYPEQEHELLATIEACLPDYDAVLFAGSRPGIWSEGLSAYISRMAMNAGKMLLVDFHGDDLERTLASCTPTIIKINDEEFCSTFNLRRYTPDDLLTEAIVAQSSRMNNCIVVTRGLRTTIAALRGEAVTFPTEQVHAVNTTGCGDAFSAGFLHEYLATGDFESALAKGTYCAARNAELECPGAIQA